MAWMFWKFITLVKWIVYLIVILVGFVLLKFVYDKGVERFSREKARRSRRGKSKRKEDLEGDGLAFPGGVTYSDSEDED